MFFDFPNFLFEIFIFCPKMNFDFPRKLSIFLGWKTRENVVILDFLAVDNFDFTRKIVKKKIGWKFVKMLGFCQYWIFGQKFDFLNSVNYYLLAVCGTDDCAMSFHCRQNSKCAISRISLEFSSFWATLGSVQAKLSNLNSEGHLGSSRALLLNMGRAKLLTGIFVFDLLLMLQWFSSFSTKVSKDLRSSVSISLAISEELHLLKIRQK